MVGAPVKRILLASITALLVVVAFHASQVHAQAASEANAANGLQVSPAIAELNGNPGQTYKINIKTTNVTSSDLVFDSNVNDFTAGKDETGAPSIDIENETSGASSIRRWITIVPSFNLAARETKTISAVVSIPADAEPGGHYGVVRFSGRTPNVNTGVGLAASTGTLMLVRVAGAVDEKLDLVTFAASKDGKEGNFFLYGPLDFVTRFENKGNVHVKPVGQIEIRNIFGNKIDTLSVNGDKGSVLPNSIRKFQSTLDKQWLFGLYTADLSVGYGTTGQAIVRTISFWVIPWRLILIVLAALVTIIFVFRTLIKRYNSYIIKSAGHSNGKSNAKKTKKRKK